MKQVIQDFKDGKIKVIDAPQPNAEKGFVIVRNRFSVISSGTERRTVNTGKKSLIGKVRARPDLAQKVINSVKKEGIASAMKKVKSRLDEYKLLGYSSSGEIIEVGDGVRDFSIGDKVACGGTGYALHSEIIKVPANLCTKFLDNVNFDEAAFATLGAIALQGIRQADVKVGEFVGVIGLGLIGILTIQILKASGCRVMGVDINKDSITLAKKFGMDKGVLLNDQDISIKVKNFTKGFGLDSAIITAATKSNEPVKQAAHLLRDRGKITIVGNVGMKIEMDPFYLKELGLTLSRSYGPGRYDCVYEEKGIDYPIGYVRWTEQRNMAAIIDLIAQNKLNIKDIITHKFSIEDALKAYDLILNGKEKILGFLFEYNAKEIKSDTKIFLSEKKYYPEKVLKAGVIGAGNFGKTYIVPPLKRNKNVELVGIATSHGANAVNVGKKFGFKYATANYKEILNDKNINTIFILTRHNLHAGLVLEGLKNGKNVYVEKPLALNTIELEKIKKVLSESKGRLLVGFNRRFSPHSIKLKNFIGKEHGPMIMHFRINAGQLPPDHWLCDPDIGGGRIIGEGCHFVDFLRFLSGSNINNLIAKSNFEKDNKVIELEFNDGSIGTIIYTTIGDISYPKERIEVFVDGKVGIIDNFRKTILSVNGKKTCFKTRAQDKGHTNEINSFVESIVKGTKSPISPEELIEVNKYTIKAEKS